MKKHFEKEGSARLASEVRWSNYRKHLIDELSKLVDKGRLNFYMEVSKDDKSGKLLREALMFHRKNA